jgi:hypothetical protein
MDVKRIILKILSEHPEGIGFNRLYKEVCKIKQCPKETFNKKLKSLVQKGLVKRKLVKKDTLTEELSESEIKKLSEEELQKLKKEVHSIRAHGVAYYPVDESIRFVVDTGYLEDFALYMNEITEVAWNILNSRKWFNLNKESKTLYCHYFKKLEKAPFLLLERAYQVALTYEGQEAGILLLKFACDLYTDYFSKWQTKLKKIRKKLKEEFPKSFKEESFVHGKLKFEQFTPEKTEDLVDKIEKLYSELEELQEK